MTLIVATEHEGSVWMAGDSASVGDTAVECVTERKVWAVNGWVFGYAGSWRGGQLTKLELKPAAKVRDVDRYVKTELVRAIRAALHSEPNDEIEGLYMLAGFAGQLYTVLPSCGMATRSRHGYAAIGAGGGLEALAATHTIRRPRARLLRVLHAVSRHSTLVRAPFYIEHTP